jgi:hypothetical protein
LSSLTPEDHHGVAFEVFLRALWIAIGGAKDELGDLRGALFACRINVRFQLDEVPFGEITRCRDSTYEL